MNFINLINRRKILNICISLMALVILYTAGNNLVLLQTLFLAFVILVYLIMLPKKLLDPKNVVFFYYFVWYGIAPLFANRYKTLLGKGDLVNYAYLMFFTVYTIAMITLDFYEGKQLKKETTIVRTDLTRNEKIFLFTVYFSALSIYVYKTGGIYKWLHNAYEAFFDRGGSGIFFLLFEYSIFLLLFYAGQNLRIWKRIPYIGLCLITMYLCGSKSIALVMVLMLFSGELINSDMLSVKSVTFITGGIAVFVIGMYIRNSNIMTSVSSVLSTSLNYFDTLDETLIVLKDFEPSWFRTFLLPLNWIFTKFGFYIGVPYHDTSIWLTTIYYPQSWANGGTHQWPMEIYLYLNFKFIFGLVFVILYFLMIGYIYKRAVRERGVWRFIYLSEIMRILSHLRGGLFNYWYIYLLPFYVILLIWEKRISCPTDKMERLSGEDEH